VVSRVYLCKLSIRDAIGLLLDRRVTMDRIVLKFQIVLPN